LNSSVARSAMSRVAGVSSLTWKIANMSLLGVSNCLTLRCPAC
jgi:hypothetical protein